MGRFEDIASKQYNGNLPCLPPPLAPPPAPPDISQVIWIETTQYRIRLYCNISHLPKAEKVLFGKAPPANWLKTKLDPPFVDAQLWPTFP
jgi:hypothetical protein